MLTKLISLYTIEEIFANDCKNKISPLAKMVYINCINHNFKNKAISLQNLNDFLLIKATIPNYDNFKKYFDELCFSGLIIDDLHSYRFISHWIKYVELHRITYYQDNLSNNKVDLIKLQEEFSNSQQLIELCQMKYNLNKSQICNLMNQFLQEQIIVNKIYGNIGDAKKHFIYWCGINKDKLPQDTSVKSKNKILGL